MEDPTGASILPFPVHRRTTIDETFDGFSGRAGGETMPGSRTLRRVTVLYADIRGWNQVADHVGEESAAALLAGAVDRAVKAIRENEPSDVTVGGGAAQPVLSATFEGEGHAERALRAAVFVRDAVASREETGQEATAGVGPAFHSCSGLNTGDIVEAQIEGGVPVSFQAVGTVRMFATRLQEFAGPDQIFLSAATYAEAMVTAKVRSIGPVRTNADGDTAEAFCLIELLPHETPMSPDVAGRSRSI
jgi:class 3 adenylate cyclase